MQSARYPSNPICKVSIQSNLQNIHSIFPWALSAVRNVLVLKGQDLPCWKFWQYSKLNYILYMHVDIDQICSQKEKVQHYIPTLDNDGYILMTG